MWRRGVRKNRLFGRSSHLASGEQEAAFRLRYVRPEFPGQRIGREYSHCQAKTVYRNLLDLSGKVEVTATSVVVTLDKRAHNPYLAASGLADQPTPMPWYGDKKSIIQFA